MHTADLGPYADRIGVAASAKLSLRACVLARTSGRTFLEFVDVSNPPTPTPAVRNCSRSGTVRVRNCAPCIGTAGDEPAYGGVATLPGQGPATTTMDHPYPDLTPIRQFRHAARGSADRAADDRYRSAVINADPFR